MNIINQYKELHRTITERAIHINDILSELEVEDELDEYLPCPIYVWNNSSVRMSIVGDKVLLSYCESFVDDEQRCSVPLRYIEMKDEEVIKDFLSEIDERHKKYMETMLQNVKRHATLCGYRLVKIED